MNQEAAGSRRIYLNDVALEEALTRWLEVLRARSALRPLDGESVPSEQALGRVTAAPVYAARSSPHYHACGVDGVAVRAAETFGASETSPVRLGPGQFVFVNTGDPLPAGFDAVVMVEEIHELPAPGRAGQGGKGGPGASAPCGIELISPAIPWQNVRPVGEDIVAGELLLPANHVIRPVDIGAMLAAGAVEVSVRRRPRVFIIPTGDELVEPGDPVKPGDIVEFNSRMLAAMAQEWGAVAVRHPPVADDLEALVAAIRRGFGHDVVVVNAGSSAGSKDLTAAAVERLGEVVVHGVRIKPGKPTVLGLAERTPVAGIPGYPVTAALTFERFVRPLVHALQGLAAPGREVVRARLTRRLASTAGVDEFI
ncbi:MAG: molybdopterin-binding protein, partial [Bacillota bacterium]